MKAAARDFARTARESERAERRQLRQAAQHQRNQARLAKAMERQEKLDYLESRLEEVADLNDDLRSKVADLQSILEQTLDVDDTINFESLKLTAPNEPFIATLKFEDQLPVPPFGIKAFFPGAGKKHEQAVAEFERKKAYFEEKIEEERRVHEGRLQRIKAKVDIRNAEVNELQHAYMELDHEAVEAYNAMVLERSDYPDDFPRDFRLVYVGDSRELVIDFQLPQSSVVPAIQEYRYVKAKDEIAEKARSAKECKDIYQRALKAIALRSIHEVLEADQANALNSVAFNGFVRQKDKATGKDIQPCVISVRATKNEFVEFDLRHVDAAACLKRLGAAVSPSPEELIAVKPIVEFNMVDKRFIDDCPISIHDQISTS